MATLARLMDRQDVSTTSGYYAVFTQKELAQQHEQFSQIRHLLDKIEEEE